MSGATVTVSATAADNVGVAGVQFKLDGANLGAEDTTSPYCDLEYDGGRQRRAHADRGRARRGGQHDHVRAVTVTVNNDRGAHHLPSGEPRGTANPADHPSPCP